MKKSEIIKKERRVAEKLKDLRIERGMSQNALADKSGIDRKTVNRIENNHFSPNLNTLFRLCETLSVKPAEVLK
jgi:DNA-binding XRE family transcriptional regulator